MSINPVPHSRGLRISVLRREPSDAAVPEADASDWKKLPADSYKALPLLGKTAHGVDVDRAATEEGRFKAYSEEELNGLELTVSEGSLRIAEIQDGVLRLGYVMFPNGKIFVSKMQVGSIYHSSFCVGREPIAAGMIKIVRGKILEINEESGHYAPNGAVYHVIKRLFDLGLRELDDCAIRTSRYSPIPSEQRSPLDKRTERLREILSAKGDAKSPTTSPAQTGRRLKEKTLTPRQSPERINSPLGSSQGPQRSSDAGPEADPLAQFKSTFSYPKDTT